MPITTSAKKALRNSRRKRVFNLARKKALATSVKNLKKLISENKGKEAKAFFPTVQQAFDKAVKTHLIKANAASRKKTRLASAIKKISQ
jgi:small subunit ribosomal protein S20